MRKMAAPARWLPGSGGCSRVCAGGNSNSGRSLYAHGGRKGNAVDLNGLPAGYDALRRIADRHGLPLIEDAAQAHGATYRDRPVGALGTMSGASLNGSKTLSALGEGGLFATRNEEEYRLARRVLMFGEELPGQGRDYNARIMGWNYRIDVLAAAFARSQLTRLPEMSRIRRANGAALTTALDGIPGIRPPVVPEGLTHVYFFYPLLVEPEGLGLEDVPVEAFREAVERAVRAEGARHHAPAAPTRARPDAVPGAARLRTRLPLVLRPRPPRPCVPARGVPGGRGDLPTPAGPRPELQLPRPAE